MRCCSWDGESKLFSTLVCGSLDISVESAVIRGVADNDDGSGKFYCLGC